MIWIVGARGMLASDLILLCQSEGIEVIASGREVDVTDIEALWQFVRGSDINYIVNCSAYTAVDNAEDDAENAYRLNEVGVENLAIIAKELSAQLIHVSTDYVFDGTCDTSLAEDAPTNPIGIYGASKLAGEQKIAAHINDYFIIRTSWLYGKHGNNFVSTIIRLMNERESLGIIEDQWGTPTWTVDLATFIVGIIQSGSENYGIYHYSGEGKTNWFEFAEEIYSEGRALGLISSECEIKAISSDQYSTRAKRPAYSLLSKEKVKANFNIEIPHWKTSLKRYLKDLV